MSGMRFGRVEMRTCKWRVVWVENFHALNLFVYALYEWWWLKIVFILNVCAHICGWHYLVMKSGDLIHFYP